MAQVITSIEVITPEMATEYLTHNIVNRKMNKGQVAYYARLMGEGKWLLNGESIVFDAKGNLSDGQHRLQAIIVANVPIQSVVVRNVNCDAFTTFDQGKARSTADSFCIKGIPNSVPISSGIRKYFNLCSSNTTSLLSLSNGNCRASKVSTQEILDEYECCPEFWQNEFRFSSRCYDRCRLLTTPEIISISAYLQMRKGYNPEVVNDFFTQLFYEECTENQTLALFRRMVVNDAMSARGVRMTPFYKTQLLIKCWEAYKKNRELKILRWVKNVDKEMTFE